MGEVNIDKIVADALTEKPITFVMDGHFFYVYPPSIGIALISQEMMKQFTLDNNLARISSVAAIIGAMGEHKNMLLRLVAIHTFANREDAIIEEKVASRVEEIQSLDNDDLAAIVLAILDWNKWVEQIEKHFAIDKQKKRKEKVMKVKDNDKSTITFGGDSLWGSFVGFLAEKFGWSIKYIVWGCSLINASLLMSDGITSVFLTDDERKKLHISTDGISVNADEEGGNDRIREILKGQ